MASRVQVGGRKTPVSKAELRVRRQLAELASERAYLDGTVARDREWARTEQAIWIWNTCHGPETYNSDDW